MNHQNPTGARLDDVTSPSPDARRALLAIADRLTAIGPTRFFTQAGLNAAALTQAVNILGYTPETDYLEAEILRHAPAIPAPVRRIVYARLLQGIAAVTPLDEPVHSRAADLPESEAGR